MGYTHYWTSVQVKKQAKANEIKYQKALKTCNKIIQGYNGAVKAIDSKHSDRLSGYSAYTSDYGGLKVNGTADLSHEDFCMPEHFNELTQDFCKTNQKPYDVIVVACLIILAHYLPDNFKVGSDGNRADWIDGLDLALKYSGLKSLKIPTSIKSRLEIVA